MMKMANLTLIVVLMSLLCVANGFFEGRVSPTFYGTASCPPVTCATCGPGEGNYYSYVDGCRRCVCKPSTACPPMTCSTHRCPPGQTMRYEYSSGCPYCYCTNPATTGCPTTIPPTCQPGAYVSCDYSSYCPNCYCRYDATTYPPYGSTYPSYQGTTPPTMCPTCPDGYTPPYPNCNCWAAASTPQSSAGLPKSRLLDMIMNVERNAMAVEQLAKNLESEAKFVYDLIQTSDINNRARRDAGEE